MTMKQFGVVDTDEDIAEWKAAAEVREHKAEWQPIETAPKDRPILGWCVHEADPYVEDEKTGTLTVYGAHVEGLSRVEDGPNVIVWGGGFDDSTWEYKGASLPDWWFRYGSEFEEAANPICWKPIDPPALKEP